MRARGAAALARAVAAALASPAFRATLDDDERAWIIVREIAAALHPLSPVHIPSPGELQRLADQLVRDAEICRTFDGRNYDQLAARHRITTRQVRRIVERQRKRIRGGA